jgi:hypothetical protein
MWWLLFEPFWTSRTVSEGGIAKRELTDTGTDKRVVRRDERGPLNVPDDAGRSPAADRRRRAKTKSKRGEVDKGGRPRSKIARKAAKKTVRKASPKAAARKGARKSAAKTRAKRR